MFHSVIAISILILVEVIEEFFSERYSFFKNPSWIIQGLFYALLITFIFFFGVFDGGQFIYFQF
jgi:hypothetical protein